MSLKELLMSLSVFYKKKTSKTQIKCIFAVKSTIKDISI